MNRQQAIKTLSEELQKMILEILDKNLRTCLNCCNFEQITEKCKLYKARPPAKIIARACESWQDDFIPF